MSVNGGKADGVDGSRSRHPWIAGLLHRKPAKLVAVAMANKAARIAWVVMTRDEIYRAPQPATGEAAA